MAETETQTEAGTALVPMAGADVQMFSFGDPESVLDRSELCQYFQVWNNGRYYEPPVPLAKLAAAFNMAPQHRSAIALKVNMMLRQHVPSRWLDGETFERFALDFGQIGNAYLEWVPNMGGRIARVGHVPAVWTRVGVEPGTFWFVNTSSLNQEFKFDAGRVWQLQQPDVAQEVYGLPEWLSAFQSGLLSEGATLFRRRYYKNGAHLGFIFYLSEPLADPKTAEMIQAKLAQAKGLGNFKNLFLNIPNGKKDGVQIMPIGDVSARDEFASIKNISAEDMLAAHRTPPQLVGIVPKNSAGFGSVSEARDDFYAAEIVPIMRRMVRVNDWAGVPVLGFADYVCANGDVIRPDGTRVKAAPAAGAGR